MVSGRKFSLRTEIYCLDSPTERERINKDPLLAKNVRNGAPGLGRRSKHQKDLTADARQIRRFSRDAGAHLSG